MLAGQRAPFPLFVLLMLIFLSPARTPNGYRAAGDGTICAALSNLATYDGDTHPCHARRRDQGCPCVECHDPCAVIHAWLLEEVHWPLH